MYAVRQERLKKIAKVTSIASVVVYDHPLLTALNVLIFGAIFAPSIKSGTIRTWIRVRHMTAPVHHSYEDPDELYMSAEMTSAIT